MQPAAAQPAHVRLRAPGQPDHDDSLSNHEDDIRRRAQGTGSPQDPGRAGSGRHRSAAGCATTGADDDGFSSSPTSRIASPASERVIAGVAEMVLTNQAWPTFEQARQNPVGSLQDGSPLYVYIRATRPLGELAHPADPGGSYTFSDYPHLFLQIGDNESLRILATCYVTLSIGGGPRSASWWCRLPPSLTGQARTRPTAGSRRLPAPAAASAPTRSGWQDLPASSKAGCRSPTCLRLRRWRPIFLPAPPNTRPC